MAKRFLAIIKHQLENSLVSNKSSNFNLSETPKHYEVLFIISIREFFTRITTIIKTVESNNLLFFTFQFRIWL